MSLQDLMPTLRGLDRADKLRVIQFLVLELAREEGALLVPGVEYPVWSPHSAYEAANALLGALDAEKATGDAER